MEARHLPNIISCCRILLVCPVVYCLQIGRYDWALVLFAVAGVSDGLDGFLAKHYHWQSRLGSYLDPVADKLLLVSSFISLAMAGLVPIWLVVTIVVRDAIILVGATAYYFLLRPFDGEPHWSSKLNTFFQLLLVLLVLAGRLFQPLPGTLSWVLAWMVFAASLSSGMVYVNIWGRRYWREAHSSRS